ncbi:MAG: hypothetical protein IJC81_04820 [Clostridia bacterium]|nr:hypothetical protein [Clostridia bacterium]
MNTYGYKENVRVKRNHSVFNTIYRFLKAVFEVLAERITKCEIRVAAVIGSFAVLLGIVGGIESGAISLSIGLPICLVLSAAALLIRFEN